MAARNVAIAKVAPFSAFKLALILNLIGLVIWLIAITFVYIGVDQAGYVEQLNSLVSGVGGEQAVTFGLVFSAALLIGVIGTVLLSVLAPISAVIYNLVSGLLGGLHVTLNDKPGKRRKA